MTLDIKTSLIKIKKTLNSSKLFYRKPKTSKVNIVQILSTFSILHQPPVIWIFVSASELITLIFYIFWKLINDVKIPNRTSTDYFILLLLLFCYYHGLVLLDRLGCIRSLVPLTGWLWEYRVDLWPVPTFNTICLNTELRTLGRVRPWFWFKHRQTHISNTYWEFFYIVLIDSKVMGLILLPWTTRYTT